MQKKLNESKTNLISENENGNNENNINTKKKLRTLRIQLNNEEKAIQAEEDRQAEAAAEVARQAEAAAEVARKAEAARKAKEEEAKAAAEAARKELLNKIEIKKVKLKQTITNFNSYMSTLDGYNKMFKDQVTDLKQTLNNNAQIAHDTRLRKFNELITKSKAKGKELFAKLNAMTTTYKQLYKSDYKIDITSIPEEFKSKSSE